jgi:hypothetical protein
VKVDIADWQVRATSGHSRMRLAPGLLRFHERLRDGTSLENLIDKLFSETNISFRAIERLMGHYRIPGQRGPLPAAVNATIKANIALKLPMSASRISAGAVPRSSC